jgi:hypothetical protein
MLLRGMLITTCCAPLSITLLPSITPARSLQLNSSGWCHRSLLILIPVEQEVSSATLLFYRPCQLLRQDFVPRSYMVLDITTLAHRQIRVTQNICMLCLAGMICIHQDKNHRDKSISRWILPHGGPVVSILILT